MKVLHLSTFLLPLTETFILDQLSDTSVEHVFAAVERVPGYSLDTVKTYTLFKSDGNRRPIGWPLLRRGKVDSFVDEVIVRERPDAILIHFRTSAHFFVKAAVRHGIPFFVFVYGQDVSNRNKTRLLNPFWIAAELGTAFANRHACGFFASSRYLADMAVKAGLDADKLHVQNLGVHLPHVKRIGFEARRRRILFVGRLIPIKGADRLIRSFLTLKNSGSDLGLDIVGDGECMKDLVALAADHPDITLYGKLPREQVMDMMARSLFFCMPSSREGLGMVYLEAQSVGTPVVALGSTGSAETMIDGVTGFYFHDPEGSDLASVLQQMTALKPDQWEAMSEAGARRVAENFEVGAQNRRLFQTIVAKVGEQQNR